MGIPVVCQTGLILIVCSPVLADMVKGQRFKIIKYFFIFYLSNFETGKAVLRLLKHSRLGMENNVNVELVHKDNLFKILEASGRKGAS